MTEKELEKLFKGKLGNREFAFNPANWEAMESMLDSKVKPAGAYYWRSAAAILLFAVGVWSMLLITPAPSEADVAGTSNQSEETQSMPEKSLNPSVTRSGEEDDRSDFKRTIRETKAEALNKEYSEDQQEGSVSSLGYSENLTYRLVQEKSPVELNDRKPLGLVELKGKKVAYNYELHNTGFTLENTTGPGTFEPVALHKFMQPHTFYIEAAPVFSAVKNSFQVGLGLHVGVGYQRNFANGLILNTGIGYTSLSGVDITNKSDSVFYNFGKEEVRTEEVNEKLDYIEVPLSIGYQINSKHLIQVGGFAGYLVNVSQEVNKEISSFKAGTEYQQHENRGYQEDFYRWNFGLDFGYRYNLSPGLSVGLHYSMGLRDITKNSTGEYQNNHATRSTRVVFRYSIL